MIDTFLDTILGFDFTSLMGVLLYWVPLSICVFGYTLRNAADYMNDKASRDSEESSYYTPSLTIGTIVGRGLAATIPVVNMWAALFDVSPKLFSRFFTMLSEMLNAPLVPDTAAAKQKRANKTQAQMAANDAQRAARQAAVAQRLTQ